MSAATHVEQFIRTLAAADVQFIIVGGIAATLHGAARPTYDLDIVYGRDGHNLERLVTALRDLHPYPRGAPAGLPFRWDVDTLARGLNFTLTTTIGDLDLLGEIPGGGGYADLWSHTIDVTIAGAPCRCVTLPTLIALKRAAGRPRDYDALAELEVLLDEQHRRDGTPRP